MPSHRAPAPKTAWFVRKNIVKFKLQFFFYWNTVFCSYRNAWFNNSKDFNIFLPSFPSTEALRCVMLDGSVFECWLREELWVSGVTTRKALLPSMGTEVSFLGPTWEKERIISWKLSSGLHVRATPTMVQVASLKKKKKNRYNENCSLSCWVLFHRKLLNEFELELEQNFQFFLQWP